MDRAHGADKNSAILHTDFIVSFFFLLFYCLLQFLVPIDSNSVFLFYFYFYFLLPVWFQIYYFAFSKQQREIQTGLKQHFYLYIYFIQYNISY